MTILSSQERGNQPPTKLYANSKYIRGVYTEATRPKLPSYALIAILTIDIFTSYMDNGGLCVMFLDVIPFSLALLFCTMYLTHACCETYLDGFVLPKFCFYVNKYK